MDVRRHNAVAAVERIRCVCVRACVRACACVCESE
jgi:hypothetical protein